MGSSRWRFHNKPLSQVANQRVEAKSSRRLANKPLKDFAQIQIISLLTGNVILPPTRYTQRMLDVHALSRLAGMNLGNFVMVDGPDTLEFHGLPIEKLPGGVCHVLQRPCQDYLFNVWGTSQSCKPGWRKWYKEFRQFAAHVPLHHTDGLGDVPVRKLIPIVMQAKAWELRVKQMASPEGETRQRFPWRVRRPWHGAIHAIARLCDAPAAEVETWMHEWCGDNAAILDALEELIFEDGPECFFA